MSCSLCVLIVRRGRGGQRALAALCCCICVCIKSDKMTSSTIKQWVSAEQELEAAASWGLVALVWPGTASWRLVALVWPCRASWSRHGAPCQHSQPDIHHE